MTSGDREATQSFPDLDQVRSALGELIPAADALYLELIEDEGRLDALEANPDLIMIWIPSFGRWPRDVGRCAARSNSGASGLAKILRSKSSPAESPRYSCVGRA